MQLRYNLIAIQFDKKLQCNVNMALHSLFNFNFVATTRSLSLSESEVIVAKPPSLNLDLNIIF